MAVKVPCILVLVSIPQASSLSAIGSLQVVGLKLAQNPRTHVPLFSGLRKALRGYHQHARGRQYHCTLRDGTIGVKAHMYAIDDVPDVACSWRSKHKYLHARISKMQVQATVHGSSRSDSCRGRCIHVYCMTPCACLSTIRVFLVFHNRQDQATRKCFMLLSCQSSVSKSLHMIRCGCQGVNLN